MYDLRIIQYYYYRTFCYILLYYMFNVFIFVVDKYDMFYIRYPMLMSAGDTSVAWKKHV